MHSLCRRVLYSKDCCFDCHVNVDRFVQGRVVLDDHFKEDRYLSEILCIRGTKTGNDGTYQFTRDTRLNLVS